MLVTRRTSGLYDKHIRAANIFLDLKIKLAVRKWLGGGLSEFAAKFATYLLGELAIGVALKYFDFSRDTHVRISSPRISTGVQT